MLIIVVYNSKKEVVGVSLTISQGRSMALEVDPSLDAKGAIDRIEMFETNKIRDKDS